jgi:CrcB protein
MQNLLAVAIGGALGAMCRYIATMACVRWFSAPIVYATFTVNVVGCFCLGLFAASTLGRDTLATAAIAIGFLGGLTTFSTFSMETVRLLQSGAAAAAVLNIAASVLIGIAALTAGLQVGRNL